MSAAAKPEKVKAPHVPQKPRVLRLYDALEALDILDELIAEHADVIALRNGDIESVPEIAELLAFAEDQFESVVDRYGHKILNLNAEAIGIKEELDRLTALYNQKKNAADRLKDFLKRQLEGRKVSKVKCATLSVWVQNNGQPSVRAVSESRIEELYAEGSLAVQQKVTYAVNYDRCVELAAADEAAKAADPNAERTLPEGIVVERGTHLRVK